MAQISSVTDMHSQVSQLLAPDATLDLIEEVLTLHDTWHTTLIPDDPPPPEKDGFKIRQAQTARRQLLCQRSVDVLSSEEVNSFVSEGSQSSSHFPSGPLQWAGLQIARYVDSGMLSWP